MRRHLRAVQMADALRNALDEAEVQAQKRLVIAVQRAVDDANARSEEVGAASEHAHVPRRDDACCVATARF